MSRVHKKDHNYSMQVCLQFMFSSTFTSALAHKELGWEEFPPWQDVVKQLIEEYREEEKAKKLC